MYPEWLSISLSIRELSGDPAAPSGETLPLSSSSSGSGSGNAVGVLKLRCLQSEESFQCLAMGVRTIGPIGLDRIPEFFQSFLIGIAVLDTETCDPIQMLQG